MSAAPQPERPADVTDQIALCWSNGIGVGRTIVSVRQVTGARVGFEQVRSQFARLAGYRA